MNSLPKSVSIESSYDVYDDIEGVSITVSGDSDSLGGVRVRTVDNESKEYFGSFDFIVSPSIARGIAAALLKKAQDIEDGEHGDAP